MTVINPLGVPCIRNTLRTLPKSCSQPLLRRYVTNRTKDVSFHVIPNLPANTQYNIPNRSPAINRSDPSSPFTKEKPVRLSAEDALPPITLLKAAHAAGALHLKPNEAQDLLRLYLQLNATRPKGWEQQVLSESNTTIATFTTLSLILNKIPTPATRILAKLLLQSASNLGDAPSTLILLTSALVTGNLKRPEYAKPLARLEVLALKEGRVEALVLLGRIREKQLKPNEALELFRRASSSASASDEGGLQDAEIAAALVLQGKILLRKGRQEEAEALFRKSALEMDNPNAYFELGKIADKSGAEKEVYLLKAASSGVKDAVGALASLYDGRGDTKMAGEWRELLNVQEESVGGFVEHEGTL